MPERAVCVTPERPTHVRRPRCVRISTRRQAASASRRRAPPARARRPPGRSGRPRVLPALRERPSRSPAAA